MIRIFCVIPEICYRESMLGVEKIEEIKIFSKSGSPIKTLGDDKRKVCHFGTLRRRKPCLAQNIKASTTLIN